MVMRELDPERCLNYVDDFLLIDNDFESHLDNMRQFFKSVRKLGLKLAFDKCNLGQKEVKFLGIILNDNGFQVNP